jgi:hypothetical protein
VRVDAGALLHEGLGGEVGRGEGGVALLGREDEGGEEHRRSDAGNDSFGGHREAYLQEGRWVGGKRG